METVTKKLYEAMFLVGSDEAARDWEGINKVVRTILEKADVDIVSMSKWDERRLAYGIAGQNRGTYILCYFNADGGRIRDIEREVRLSERIMRVLILDASKTGQGEIKGDDPEVQAEKDVRQSDERASEPKPQEGVVVDEQRSMSSGAVAAEALEPEQLQPETEGLEASDREGSDGSDA